MRQEIKKEGDFYKLRENKKMFYVDELDMYKIYKKRGWNILEYGFGWRKTTQKNNKGKPFKNKGVIIMAQKSLGNS